MSRLVVFLVLLVATSAFGAPVSCDGLQPGADHWDQHMAEVAAQSGLGGSFAKQHQRAVLFYCRYADEMVNQIVADGGISASDLARIKKVVTRPDQSQYDARRRSDLLGKSLPGFEAMDRAVNVGFAIWSKQWGVDKYIGGTAHGAQQRPQQGEFVSLGTFKFSRGGALMEAQFAAKLRKSGEAYDVVTLCYNDQGQQECVDGPALVARAVALGILTAGASGLLTIPKTDAEIAAEEKSRREGKNCVSGYSYGTPDMLGYQRSPSGGGGIPFEICN